MGDKKYRRNDDAINRFGKNMRMFRKTAGLTMIQLAEKCDTDYTQISNMELGKTDPSLSNIVMVANALGVTVGKLVDE